MKCRALFDKGLSVAERRKGKTGSRVAKSTPADVSEKTLIRFQVITRTFDIGQTAIRCGTAIALVYFGIARPLQLTAGKQTIVNFVYSAAFDMKLHMIVPWAAAALFGGLWYRERNLRKKTVAREHGRVEELEKQLDPGRTSSGLTPMGDDPKDRP